jgi:nucleoside 2-deoxyribosyltransferase
MKPTVYLAGPITGLNYHGASEWREDVYYQLADIATILSPMRNKESLAHIESLEGHVQYGELEIMSSPSPVFARDRYDVKRADVLLINLLGATRVSIGTVFEIGYAVALGKLLVVAMEDSGNPHDHLFVTAAASIRVNNLDDAVYATRSFLGN